MRILVAVLCVVAVVNHHAVPILGAHHEVVGCVDCGGSGAPLDVSDAILGACTALAIAMFVTPRLSRRGVWRAVRSVLTRSWTPKGVALAATFPSGLRRPPPVLCVLRR